MRELEEQGTGTAAGSSPSRERVVVVGGGPAGLAAAVAAARMGERTVLIERHPVLGGMGTAALVSNFCNAHWDGERFIIGGIFGELRQRMIERNAVFVTGGLEPYDPVALAEETRELCTEAGVQLRMGVNVVAARAQGHLINLTLSDGSQITAATLVDASGDAHVSALLGVASMQGRARDGAVMPLTYCYVIGPVDLDELAAEMPDVIQRDRRTGQRYAYLGGHARLTAAVQRARATGELTIPRDRIAVAFSIPGRPDHLAVNFGRVFIDDPTDPAQLAAAEVQGRAQIAEGERFFRKYVPGFARCRVVEIARQIGVRESRQIVGRYTLTGQDVLACRQFDDVIAQCCYSIDIHEPDSDRTTMHKVPSGQHYDIPWRCLVPAEGPPGLIVAGRSISATNEAMSSFRVTPSVMAIGEAAGVTAALASQRGIAIAAVPVADVQDRLRATAGILT